VSAEGVSGFLGWWNLAARKQSPKWARLRVVAGGRLIGGIKTHARERAAYAFKTGWQRRRKHFERLSRRSTHRKTAQRDRERHEKHFMQQKNCSSQSKNSIPPFVPIQANALCHYNFPANNLHSRKFFLFAQRGWKFIYTEWSGGEYKREMRKWQMGYFTQEEDDFVVMAIPALLC